MDTTEPAESIFDEKYEILGQLGAGGLGTVYKAKQIDFDRTVALKILHKQFAVDDEFKTRFLREAKALNLLKHPNIVQIFHLGVAATGQPYLAMELIEGKNCRKLLNEQDRLPTLIALKIVHDAALALSYVHENGIVHRDLKPENILVLNEPEPNTVKLIDFGLVRLLDSNEKNQKLTQTGDLLGTAAYMSPEQCKGQKADSRADIYSLGVCLFELLTGEKCYTADSDVGLLYKHATEAPPTVKASMVETYSPSLDLLISKSMQKDPNLRFQSMKEMATAIESAMLEIEKRTQNNPKLALKRNLVITIISAIAFSALTIIAFKTYSNSLDKPISSNNSTKQKELPPPETVHLPLKSQELHTLVYKYRESQGQDAGLTIANRWLKVHEKHAEREDRISVYVLLANIYAGLHRTKEMEYFANKVFSDHDALRQSVAVTNYMANCYLAEHQPAKALERIEKTLDSQPIFKQKPPLSLLNAKASTLVEMGDYEKAIKIINTITPENKVADPYGEIDSLAWHLTLIRAYSKANKNLELNKTIAETIELAKAQQADSTIPLAAAYMNIALTLRNDSKDAEDILHYARLAVPLLLKTKAFDSADRAEDIIGTTLQTQGKYAEAMAAYQLIANNNAKYQQPYNRKAINFIHLYECSDLVGDYRSAESYIQQAEQCISDEYERTNALSFRNGANVYWACISNLSDHYINTAEYSKGEQLLSKWMELARRNKVDSEIYALMSCKKCEILFKTKNFSEAIKCAENAQTVLDNSQNIDRMSDENRMAAVLKTHVWKDMALSLTKDTQASQRETDWIVQSLASTKQIPTQTKVRYFQSFANVYYACKQTVQADICCNEAEKLLRSSDSALNEEQIADYLQIAEFRSWRFQNSAAESIFRTCISRLNEIGQHKSVSMVRSKIGLGEMLQRQEKYKEAETTSLEALKLAKQLRLKNLLYFLCHRVLWAIYFYNQEYQKAKQIAEISVEIAPAKFLTMAYCDEANTCRKLKEFVEAERLVITAIEHAHALGRARDKIGAPESLAFAEDTYAQLYLDQKMYLKSLEHSNRAIEFGEQADSDNNEGYLAEAYHKKAFALTKMNRKAEAIPCLIKARALFDSLGQRYKKEKADIADLMKICSKTEHLPSH